MKKNEAISILATSVRPREQKDRARYDEAVKMAIDALNEPERKTGKWIEQDDGWDGVYYECSCCKEAFTLIDGTPSENLYDYCPNCGARLVQEGEDNDV